MYPFVTNGLSWLKFIVLFSRVPVTFKFKFTTQLPMPAAASNADWPAHLCGPSCGGTVQDELLKTALVSHILAGKYKKTRGQDGRHKPVSGHGEGRYLRTCFGGKTGGQACERKVITCFSRNLEEKTVTIVDLSSKERERRPVLDCNAPGELRSLVKLHLSYEDYCCCYTIVSENWLKTLLQCSK